VALLGLAAVGNSGRVRAEEPTKAAAEKPAPENVDDLRAIEKQVAAVVAKVQAATVGVRIGSSQGSGVIVTKDGYVLTAGHVSGKPDREVALIFPDGKTVKGKTLGYNPTIDSGLIKITEEGEWPAVEMGHSNDLKRGQWVVALGHPGGYLKGRTPPVRLGRILTTGQTLIRTDCTLVGGDSGGPLFDLEGRVIGIHSRIGGTLTENVHVPVETYRDTWAALVKGDTIGKESEAAFLGVGADPDADECKLNNITEDSPAAKAGLKVDDVVTAFEGRKVAGFADLSALVRGKKPGDEVTLEVRRGDEKMKIKVTLTKRPD
jgi:serine protease Do